MIDMIFAGIGTASAAISTLSSIAKSKKGLERAFLLEVNQNIRLLEEYRNKDLDLKKLVPELETKKFKEIYESNYNFNKLQRNKISHAVIAQIKSLKRYEGWNTEKLITNIFEKIIHIQKLVKIGYDEDKIDIPRRLHNLLILLILLSQHIS